MIKINRLAVLFLLLSLQGVAVAHVSHISINSRMFEVGNYPKLRLNVIADNRDLSRLAFVVVQNSGEEKLMAEQLNRYLILLTGVEDVIDSHARLLVREYRIDHWVDVKSISLFNAPTQAATAMNRDKKTSPSANQRTEALPVIGAEDELPQSVVVRSQAYTAGRAVNPYLNNPTADQAANPKSTSTNVAAVTQSVSQTRPALVVASQSGVTAKAGDESAPVEIVAATGFRFADDLDDAKAVLNVASDSVENVALNDPMRETQAQTLLEERIALEKTQAPAPNSRTEQVEQNTSSTAMVASTTSVQSGQCLLNYQRGETLWRIGNRYAPQWHTNVYGAMLAIYESNPNAFAKQKIGALRSDANLSCPSASVLAKHQDAVAAKAEFTAKVASQ